MRQSIITLLPTIQKFSLRTLILCLWVLIVAYIGMLVFISNNLFILIVSYLFEFAYFAGIRFLFNPVSIYIKDSSVGNSGSIKRTDNILHKTLYAIGLLFALFLMIFPFIHSVGIKEYLEITLSKLPFVAVLLAFTVFPLCIPLVVDGVVFKLNIENSD